VFGFVPRLVQGYPEGIPSQVIGQRSIRPADGQVFKYLYASRLRGCYQRGQIETVAVIHPPFPDAPLHCLHIVAYILAVIFPQNRSPLLLIPVGPAVFQFGQVHNALNIFIYERIGKQQVFCLLIVIIRIEGLFSQLLSAVR